MLPVVSSLYSYGCLEISWSMFHFDAVLYCILTVYYVQMMDVLLNSFVTHSVSLLVNMKCFNVISSHHFKGVLNDLFFHLLHSLQLTVTDISWQIDTTCNWQHSNCANLFYLLTKLAFRNTTQTICTDH